jgi:SAM-dependent methyltransferase
MGPGGSTLPRPLARGGGTHPRFDVPFPSAIPSSPLSSVGGPTDEAAWEAWGIDHPSCSKPLPGTSSLAHRNGWHDRFLAWFMARSDGKYDALVEGRKRALLAGLSGTLVEIGSGTGPNLRYLPSDLRVLALEPNPFMHHHFLREARRRERSVDLILGDAEALPFPDESVDAVLSTLVLCSVGGLDRALREIHRVLKPGGRFIFVEHVGARPGSWLRRVQRWAKPAWRAVGDGCEPDRDTDQNLHRAGFQEVHLERFHVPIPLVSPHIAGTAVK